MCLVHLTPWLTGAGSRRLEGTNIGHENAEGMAYVGVRVEPTVRLGSAGTVLHLYKNSLVEVLIQGLMFGPLAPLRLRFSAFRRQQGVAGMVHKEGFLRSPDAR